MSAKRRDLVAALRERGLVHQVTDEALGPHSKEKEVVGYIGFDPTAPSLHVGSLYPVMLLVHLARAGHRPIAVFGGGTGLIGDPSGKSSERPLLGEDVINANVDAQKRQILRIVKNADVSIDCVNNAEWLKEVRLLEFLRDIGKHFTVNWMMAKDSVKTRLEDRDHGISFTEFSYMLLQAYDFYHLWKERGCRLQMGGSDQWGNITAGVELIRRISAHGTFGLTSPLLTDSGGRKFGKTESGAIWLDPALTDPTTEFFQFWRNCADDRVNALILAFTLLSPADIDGLAPGEQPQEVRMRTLKDALAFEVTRLVHGPVAAQRAQLAARELFGPGTLEDLSIGALESMGVPTVTRRRGEVLDNDAVLVTLFMAPEIGLIASRSEWKRQLKQGSIYVNHHRVDALDDGVRTRPLAAQDLVDGAYLILRRGKKQHALVRVVDG